MEKSKEQFIGQFFQCHHKDFYDEVVGGRILDSPAPGWYFVIVYFELGSDSTGDKMKVLVRIEEMKDWFFYDKYKDMRQAFEEMRKMETVE